MNILIYSTSEYSNTGALEKEFEQLCLSRGHEVSTLVYGTSMRHCTGCKACYKTGNCIIGDSISDALAEKWQAIVIVSPVYFFALSSRAELFLDRLYSKDLNNTVLGLILPSGSKGYEGGVDLIRERFSRIDNYCGSHTVPIFNKVTADESLPVTEKDRKGLLKLLVNIERGVQ